MKRNLSHWAKQRLRRQWSDRESYGSRHVYRSEHQKRAALDETDKLSLTDKEDQKHDKERGPLGTRSERFIAAFTFVLMVVGALQWDATRDQIKLAQNSARDTAADTNAALNVSTRAATAAEQQSKATEKQSLATEKALEVSSRVAKAAEQQAKASEIASQTGQQQVSLANRQLRQNLELFAAQQRPIVHVDSDSKHSSRPKEIDGEIRWNYGFKNFGAGPAFDVVFYEAISLYNGPFQETRRLGSKMDVPGTSHWSTARYFRPPGDIPAEWPYPTLRVRFEYSDALGKRYTTVSCYQIDRNESVIDCTSADEARDSRKK